MKKFLTLLLLLCASYALIQTGLFFHSLSESVIETRNHITGTLDQIQNQVKDLPPMVLKEVHKQASRITDKTDSRLQSIQQDVKDLGFMAVTAADQRLGEAVEPVKGAATAVENFQADLHPVLQNAAGITHQVDDNLPMFLDCEYNPDCLFNRYQGASKAFEKAMVNFGEASKFFPDFVKTGQGTNVQLQGISTDFHHIIGQIDKRYFTPLPLKTRIWHGIEDTITLGGAAAKNGLLP